MCLGLLIPVSTLFVCVCVCLCVCVCVCVYVCVCVDNSWSIIKKQKRDIIKLINALDVGRSNHQPRKKG